MAIFDRVVGGCFGRVATYIPDASGERYTHWRDFTVLWQGVTFKVMLIADGELRGYAEKPDLFIFPVLDHATQRPKRQWVLVHSEALAVQLSGVDPSLTAGSLERRFYDLSPIRESLVYPSFPDRLMETLGKRHYFREFRIFKHFGLLDAERELGFVVDMIPVWEGEPADSGWRDNGSTEWTLAKRKEARVATIQPRTVVALRKKKDGPHSGRVFRVWVLFNQAFPKGDPARTLEGRVGGGGDNEVKFALELFSGQPAAFRRTYGRGRVVEKAEEEEALIAGLPDDIVLKSFVHGRYVGKEGEERYMSLRPLFYANLNRYMPTDPILQLLVATNSVRAVQIMHAHGVAHRDLKHDAFLLTKYMKQVRLSDFGRAVRRGAANELVRAGTPEYLFPFASPRSPLTDDRFGLGLILWSLLNLRMERIDGSYLTFPEYFAMMSSLRREHFTAARMNYDEYFVAVREEIGENWIVEPPGGTLDYVVWSLLRCDLTDFERDEDYLIPNVLEPLKRAYECEVEAQRERKEHAEERML